MEEVEEGVHNRSPTVAVVLAERLKEAAVEHCCEWAVEVLPPVECYELLEASSEVEAAEDRPRYHGLVVEAGRILDLEEAAVLRTCVHQ